MGWFIQCMSFMVQMLQEICSLFLVVSLQSFFRCALVLLIILYSFVTEFCILNPCFYNFQTHGFTCGVDDLIILKDMDEERTKQLQECENVGERVLRKTFGIDVDVQIGMYILLESMYCINVFRLATMVICYILEHGCPSVIV